MTSWGSFLDFLPFFVDVVRGVDAIEEVVVMGVLGATPLSTDMSPGDAFGPTSDAAGEPCNTACSGVDSVDGTVVPAGVVTMEELADGASLGGGDEAARSC